MKKFGILIVALIIAASVTVVMARPHGKGTDGPDGRGGKNALSERLNLTEEQTTKMEALRESLKEDTAPIREAMKVKKDELKELWAAENPDADAIKAAEKEMQALQSQISEKMIENRLAVHEILTPEQREQIGNKGFVEKKGREAKRGKRGGPAKGDEEAAEQTNI